NAAQWFGVGEDCETKQQVWHRKSLRHCSQRYGKLKAQYREPETASTMDQNPDSPATTKLPRVDAHEEMYSMADDVFESPPMSASVAFSEQPEPKFPSLISSDR
ncbi:hypothetical protein XENOCAPTIV_028227, partial [Xenoophorus captivus]